MIHIRSILVLNGGEIEKVPSESNDVSEEKIANNKTNICNSKITETCESEEIKILEK